MSAFSERIRREKEKSFFKVADFEGGKKLTLTIHELQEEVRKFDETMDLLCFEGTSKQLKLNQTTSEWLLDNFGDDPERYPGRQVTLYLDKYKFKGESGTGIRLKLPGDLQQPTAPASSAATPPPRLSDRRTNMDDEIPF